MVWCGVDGVVGVVWCCVVRCDWSGVVCAMWCGVVGVMSCTFRYIVII